MDPLTIGMLAILAVLIFFMFRNSRKRKAQMEELRTQIVPGAEVMTNFGLYGTLVSIDETTKVAELEVAPGNIVRVHSQTIAKVVGDEAGTPGEPRSVEEAMAIANREAAERDGVVRDDSSSDLTEPEFGERVDGDAKSSTESAKKASE
ncbi:preprotein translocase subunit YajC [Salinibacterium sp. CAN_S4]|uniref:preprotein translocase subunit YajC n=1 Tax=Salinibacterium sp. CAN_S4 TaxID=2787727 RepID=UPI0018EF6FB1